MSVDINQLALKSNEVLNKQKSSKKIKDKLTGKGMDLTNGLSEKELKKIDKNGDGKVTQKEFIENFDKRDQKTAKKLYQEYFEAFKEKTTKKEASKNAAAQQTSNTAEKETSKSAAAQQKAAKSTKKASLLNATKVSETQITKYKNGQTKTKTTKDKNGNTVVINYNKNGQKSSKITTAKDGTQTEINYKDNKPVKRSVSDKQGKVETETTYSYNEKGVLKKKRTTDFDNNTHKTTTYNEDKKPQKTITITQTGKTISKTSYSYDSKGNLTSKNKTNNITGAKTTYTYDKNGNLDTKTTVAKNGNTTSVDYGKITSQNGEQSRIATITKNGKTYTEKQIFTNGKVSKKQRYEGVVSQKELSSKNSPQPISETQISRDALGRISETVQVLYNKDGSAKSVKIGSYNKGRTLSKSIYGIDEENASDAKTITTDNYQKYLGKKEKVSHYDNYGNFVRTGDILSEEEAAKNLEKALENAQTAYTQEISAYPELTEANNLNMKYTNAYLEYEIAGYNGEDQKAEQILEEEMLPLYAELEDLPEDLHIEAENRKKATKALKAAFEDYEAALGVEADQDVKAIKDALFESLFWTVGISKDAEAYDEIKEQDKIIEEMAPLEDEYADILKEKGDTKTAEFFDKLADQHKSIVKDINTSNSKQVDKTDAAEWQKETSKLFEEYKQAIEKALKN